MRWEEKLAALNLLNGGGGAVLRMRAPGDWLLMLPDVEIKRNDGQLDEVAHGPAATPEDAVNQVYEIIEAVGEDDVVLGGNYNNIEATGPIYTGAFD